MGRATMRDVAIRAGVSIATVSHVINNSRFVGEETKNRVLNAIKEMNYRPSAVARGLATNNTYTIGIIISEQSNIFFSDVIEGVEQIFRPENYGLMVCSTSEELILEEHYFDMLLSQRVDGIIAAAISQYWNVISEAEKRDTPIVFVDRYYDSMEGFFVGSKSMEGAYEGVNHLIERGHRKIGILSGFDRLSTMRDRFEGYSKALNDAGLEFNPDWTIPSQLSVDGGRRAIQQLFSARNHPTAVFVNNNLLSLGALLEIKKMGLTIPEDLAIVGFDDHPWAAVSNPALTVVKQPAKRIGEISAKILLSKIRKEPIVETQIFLDCELIIRESS